MNALEQKMRYQLKFDSDQIFIKDKNRELSYNAFRSFVLNASTHLRTLDLNAHDLVLVDIKDPFYFAAYVFACFHLKLKPALLNSYFKKEQIDGVLKDNVYSGIITDQTHHDYKVTLIDSKAEFQLETGDINIDLDSEIIFFTSGSIQSKASVLTLKNFFYNAQGSHENIPFHESDSWGLSLPLFHVGGFSILIRGILSYGTVVVLNSDTSYSDQINEHKLTHVSFVSTQFLRYLESFKASPSLKHILLGGSAIPEKSILQAIELKLPIYKSYGMTEMASQICTSKKIQDHTEISNSGFLLNYRELKITDKQIYVKGPCLFKGYLKNNELVSATIDQGWFFTKDFGLIENRKIQILGRSDRIFQSAGENISPELIEQELLKVPGILKAYVCPEIDSSYGLRAVAYIEKDNNLKDEVIYKELEGKLSGLYRPKALKPWSESPKISWKQ